MNYQKVINYKLQTLIDLMLTDGVSPSDLSDNIFCKDYVSISFKKKDNNIIGELLFLEDGNLYEEVKMIYTYTLDKKLIRIEDVNKEKLSVLWDRKTREEELLEELIYFMSCSYSDTQIQDFIDTLPYNLGQKIIEYMRVSIA